MPKGHATKREAKKPKKKAKKLVASTSVYAEQEVEIIRKKRKPKDETDFR